MPNSLPCTTSKVLEPGEWAPRMLEPTEKGEWGEGEGEGREQIGSKKGADRERDGGE